MPREITAYEILSLDVAHPASFIIHWVTHECILMPTLLERWPAFTLVN